MIINFATIRDSYYTPEESDQLDKLKKELKELNREYKKEHGQEFEEFLSLYNSNKPINLRELTGWKKTYLQEHSSIIGRSSDIKEKAKQRYREAKGVEGILEDIRTIVEAYTLEDFHAYLEGARARLKAHNSGLVRISYESLSEQETQAILEAYSENSLRNLQLLLFSYCEEPYSLLIKEGDEATKQAREIIKQRCKELGYTDDLLEVKEETELPEFYKYDFVYPTTLQQNLTKANTEIFDHKNSIEALKQGSIDVTPNNKKGIVSYYVTIDLSAPELKGTENITEYDKSVHNMAVSIGRANEHGFFTAKQVATALLYGDNPSNSNPSKQQIGAVTKSIEKLALIRLTIDWTEHIKLNNKINPKGNLPEDASNFQVTDYMLPVRRYTATIHGQKVEGYEFIDKKHYTPLNHYATSVRQIGQHPVKMLNIPINLDQTKIVIRDYLLEEISHIKKREGWNKTISVDKLLEVAGEDSQTIKKEKRKKLLDAVEEMLTYWKKEDYIKGYTKNRANTTGKPLRSYTIEA